MGDLIDDYTVRGEARDEMTKRGGSIDALYSEVAGALSGWQRGVTFDLDGEERPFPIDVVPRLFSAREWQTLDEGLDQRVRALECFLSRSDRRRP
ncbi:MAG TPA: hypothetical protein VNG12_26935 [Acidimicrobiales bacterium]|nr:hypothetical protein [Acidimicrobiales bacterium]